MAISISTLSNGLRVITDSNERVDSAAIGVWINVGSRYEDVSVNGIAHFLEHMAFKGTSTRSAKDIAEAIEDVGGYLNACTSRETTSYYARVLKEDVPLALDILSDILQNSTFDETELAREREVILQEISQCNDTPDDVIFDHFQAVAYKDQAIGRSILGPQNIIRNMKREDLKKFIQEKYVASRMVLSAAGNIDHEQIVAMAEEKFSQLTPDANISFAKGEYIGGQYTETRALEQLHLLLGYEGVALDDPHYYTTSVLATMLGGGMSSRLFQEIREKRGLAYSIYAFKSSFTDTGMFGIYAGTSPHQANELLDVIQDETRNIEKNLDEQTLMRSRAQLKASLLMSLENIPTRCEQLAQHTLFFGRPISRAEVVDRIDAVTHEAILTVAEKVFSSAPTFAALGDISQLKGSASIVTDSKIQHRA